jgi:glycerol-3-phosphate dehydrogenase
LRKAFEMKQRTKTIQETARSVYDVCVVGGGASGAGCALDSQLRGFKTILVDAGDFGSGTSTASTKLIHGGLRYLQQAVAEFDIAQYRVVRLALSERRQMMNNAPHLSQACEFVVPCYSFFEAAYYDIGLKLYDWLSGDASLAASRFVNRAKSLSRMPSLKDRGLFGTVVYSDGQFDDARYNLALVQSSLSLGSRALNYARLLEFERDRDGHLIAALIEDRLSGQRFRVAARAFVNATGPFSDQVRSLAGIAKERIILSRGVHILLPLPEEFGNDALLIPKTDDGRVIFAIPWQGRLLVGTTETESTLNAELIVTRHEAEFLLRHLNRYLATPFEITDIVSAIAGLRPLVRSGNFRETKKLIRDYEIEVDQHSRLISVLGGKWTVYRAMAEDAINAVQKMLTGRITDSRTRDNALFGAKDQHECVEVLLGIYGVPSSTIRNLTKKFGGLCTQVLNLAREDPSLGSPIVEGSPHIQAEVIYCVREEMAVSIEDILVRRLGLQFYDWRLSAQAAPVVGHILSRELGWSPARVRTEVTAYIDRVNRSLEALGQERVCVTDIHRENINDELHRRA